jgi:hypothetical protein
MEREMRCQVAASEAPDKAIPDSCHICSRWWSHLLSMAGLRNGSHFLVQKSYSRRKPRKAKLYSKR